MAIDGVRSVCGVSAHVLFHTELEHTTTKSIKSHRQTLRGLLPGAAAALQQAVEERHGHVVALRNSRLQAESVRSCAELRQTVLATW